jgi:hypothetical protein
MRDDPVLRIPEHLRRALPLLDLRREGAEAFCRAGREEHEEMLRIRRRFELLYRRLRARKDV